MTAPIRNAALFVRARDVRVSHLRQRVELPEGVDSERVRLLSIFREGHLALSFKPLRCLVVCHESTVFMVTVALEMASTSFSASISSATASYS